MYELRSSKGEKCLVHAQPPVCDVGNPDDFLFCRVSSLGYRDAAGEWQSLEQSQWIGQSPSTCNLNLSAREQPFIHIAVDYALQESLLTLTLRAAEKSGVDWLSLTLSARREEHFYGLGERFDSLDQRGKTLDLQVRNAAQGQHTYQPIPFYISSAGYGLSLDTSARVLIRLATPDDPTKVTLRAATDHLVVHFFLDRQPKRILEHYTELVGRPETPPAWIFGPWKSRDWRSETQETVLEDVDVGRSCHLPGSVKVIDAAWETVSTSFTFDPRKFPRVPQMIAHVHEQGYQLILWISPWMVKDPVPSEVYRLCAERGYLIRDPQGNPYVHRLANSPSFVGSCFDFTNPEAVDWWKQHIRRLAEMGVNGFKTDFGEQVPEDALFFDGRTGRELHNLYPYLYNRATYQALRERTEGVLLERSAWAGCQGLSLIWAGDQTSDFAPASGLPSAIIAGQSAGLSGFPFWTCDIGGYFGQPTDEAFIRWTEFAALSPIMQIHGLGNREPWHFSASVLEIYRRYAQEHLDLLPYLYSFARQASHTGLPLMRALFLEFPDDPAAHCEAAQYEYLLGDQLLVCPVYAEGERRRQVYLPAGIWRSYWTGELLHGGQTQEVPVALHEIPVFVRAGALVPRLDGFPETVLPAADPSIRAAGTDLRLDVFAGQDGEITLVDGTRCTWRDADRHLTVKNSGSERQISFRLAGERAPRAEASLAGGQALEGLAGSLGGDSTYTRIHARAGDTVKVRFLAG